MPSYSGVFTLQAQMQAIAAGTWTGIPLVIGQAYGGGYYAGQIGVSGVATHNLVVGPVASAQSTLQFKTVATGGDSTSTIDGPTNSAAMNSATYPAAQFCEGLSIGGFTDWYLPAVNELEVCYYNLKPTTDTNNPSSGINPNSVPVRSSNYPSGDPAQTSAALFITGTGAEAFTNLQYWTSTQSTYAGSGRYQRFSNGFQDGALKTFSLLVRAIRRVAV